MIGFTLVSLLDYALDGKEAFLLTWKLYQESVLSDREGFICGLLILISKWCSCKTPREMLESSTLNIGDTDLP